MLTTLNLRQMRVSCTEITIHLKTLTSHETGMTTVSTSTVTAPTAVDTTF